MSSFIIFSTVILVSKYYAVVVRHWFSNIYFCVSLQKMPSYSVSIRAIETEKHQVIDKRRNEILEEIEESKAFFQVVTLNSLLSNFCCKPTQYFTYQSASNFLKYLLRFFFFLPFRCMMVPCIFIKGGLTQSKAWICLVRLLFVKRLI